MDIENVWRESRGPDDTLGQMLQRNDFSSLPSRLPLARLKKNLVAGIVLALIITALYAAVIFYLGIWQVTVSLGALSLFNLFIAHDSWKLYKSINEDISPTNSVREELQKNYDGFRKWWQVQERLGLFVYPIAAAGGFIVGGVSGSGKPAEAFLYNQKTLLLLGATLAILVPLCFFGARWMFQYAYGKHLKKLKAAINELTETP